jgi:hypothetical protein
LEQIGSETTFPSDGPDPSTLPPATAPPSHPPINQQCRVCLKVDLF